MTKYSSYILFLLISILVVILSVNDPGPLNRLQRSINDALARVTAADTAPSNIVLVTVDHQAEKRFGTWPWNHDRIADLLAATAGAEPKAIMVNIPLSEDATQDSAGYTGILAEQLSWIKTAVLPYDIALSNYRSSKTSNPKCLFNSSISVDNPLGIMSDAASLNIRKIFLPAERLLSTNPRLGFDLVVPDEDRVLRYQPMVMNYEGYYYPSLSLAAAATYLGVSPSQIKVIEKKEILLGNVRRIPINDQGGYFICFTRNNPFTRFSAAEVLGDKFDFSRLRGKLVVIGVESPTYNERFVTSGSDNTSDLAVKASVAENIINGNILALSDHATPVDMLVLFILGALGAFIMPRMTILYRIIVLLGGLVILANVNYFMVSAFRVVPETVYIMIELLFFMAAAPLLDSQILASTGAAKQTDRKQLPKVAVAKTSQSSRKKTEKAAPVREVRSAPTDADNLRTAAVNPDAHTPFDHQTISLDSEDITEVTATAASPSVRDSGRIAPTKASADSGRIPASSDSGNVKAMSDSWPSSDSGGIRSDSQPIPASADQAELKSLGRYQITGTLGKGAMGLVYRGIDPAINRPVALKTIRLDFVNDPNEMEELKERLYREAQAAGKLSHPNIVTIYDVGSEGPLQYIAMEFLEGVTLEGLIKKKTKFNYRIISSIITQICAALEYAHERGIVHRDIKPANVMVLNDYKIKVMDFGIARIDSNSMTKTGIAMGTPNYISPEQLRGLPIDGRADIFSLGVVMYEMLLSRRPFKGENITSLIYSIVHHEPEKPSNINPQIPLLLDHVIARALKKNPQERYQKASEIVADLHDFVESFVNR